MSNKKFAELDYHIFRDEGEVSRKAIGGLMQNLMTSIIIVSIVLWLFLGLRSASVVAIAIPLTMAGVFIIGYSLGKNINRVTLFALILSLGLLVDSATVVVENIYRHLQEKAKSAKKSIQVRREAIVEAVNEVGIGLFLSTLTSVIVFLPTSNLSGMMGDYMGPLSVFLPIALTVSMFVAYILTPFLADIILPLDLSKKEKNNKKSFFDKVTDKYTKVLNKILNNAKIRRLFLLAVFGALFISLSFPIFKLVHFKMLPSADKNQFFVYIDAPQDTNYPMTEKIAEFVSNKLLENPEIVSVQSFVGTASVVDFNGLFKGSNYRIAPYMATLRVNLTDTDDRSIKSTPLLDEERRLVLASITKDEKIEPEFREILRKTNFRFLEDPPGPPVRATLMAKIKGPNREILKKVARDVEEMFHHTDRAVDIDTTIGDEVRKVSFRVDHEKALEAGIATAQIYETLSAITGEKMVSQFHLKNSPEMINITLSVPVEERDELVDLNEVYIKNFAGNMIPLSAVVQKVETRPEEVLYLDIRDETVYVTGELENRSVVYATIDLMFDIFDYEFPDEGKIVDWSLYGFDFETKSREIYHIEWGGERELTLDNFRDLGLAMIIAFIAIYAVLVAQFESFKVPLLIMSTVFLGLLGILPGFAILDKTLGTFLTATSLIGFIALMGIVVNNAIIYLEYFDILRDRGLSLHDALFQAGKTRLRPIVLTSMTTVLGNLTIINDPVWSGLAWAIIFGLSISAAFTLVVFPALMASFPPKVRDKDHLIQP
jgi:multidrug efflux pump subunit AcrB